MSSPTLRLTRLIVLSATIALLTASPTFAAAPGTGAYKAITSQCGTPAKPHPCYSFTFKIAKGRCVSANHVGHGLCVGFHPRSNGSLVESDVTCPDGLEFASQIGGPQTPLLLSSKNALKFKASGGSTEAGKPVVFDVETLAMTFKGSTATGTLSLLTEESLGTTAPPQCVSGHVSFTAKRT